MPISKKDLSLKISSKLEMSKNDSLDIVDTFFKFFISENQNRISIHSFGTFFYKISPQRVGRNPKTKQEFIIKERKKLCFSPSDFIKKSLN